MSTPSSAPRQAQAALCATCRGAPCACWLCSACVRRASRYGPSLFAQVSQSSAVVRATGSRRHARRGPQVRRSSPAHLRALAKLEPKPEAKGSSPELCGSLSEAERKRSEAHKEDTTIQGPGARVCKKPLLLKVPSVKSRSIRLGSLSCKGQTT